MSIILNISWLIHEFKNRASYFLITSGDLFFEDVKANMSFAFQNMRCISRAHFLIKLKPNLVSVS